MHLYLYHVVFATGMISYMDMLVKRITDALKMSGLWENTIMIFSTGNPKPILLPFLSYVVLKSDRLRFYSDILFVNLNHPAGGSVTSVKNEHISKFCLKL